MTQVVQATCPGCKNILRIPADWIAQPIRCKHCGLVMQARQPAASAHVTAPPPVPAARTPLPNNRRAAPPPVPAAVTTAPKAPTARVAVQTPPVPTAPPVAYAPSSGSPFGDLRTDESPTSRRHRRRKGGWKGPLILLAVFGIAGGVMAANWERVKALFPPEESKENTKVADARTEDPEPKKPAHTEPSPKRANPVKGPTKPTKEPGKGPKSNPRPPVEKPRDPVVTRPKPPITRPKPPVVKKPPRRIRSDLFPRRALIISVHNYLFANPVQSGVPGMTHNVSVLPDALNNGLNINLEQILHLSDVAKSGRSRWPVKKVIEETLTSFLDTSRPQDRIMVFFIGHAVEIGDEPYLVPIEGELGEADTLIPLKWVYDKLARCKARQKVLVLDAFRNNPTLGQERPTAGAMGPKTDAMLRSPPLGVQVWSSCVEKQYSYETDDSPMGTFLAELYDNTRRGLMGKIQHPEDPLPLEPYLERINGGMKKELDRLGLVQVSRLTGMAPPDGAAYDPSAPPAPPPTLAAGIPMDDSVGTLIAKVEEEVGTPPVKVATDDRSVNLSGLPPFDPAIMKKYEDDGKGDPKSPLRVAVRKARAALWAVNIIPPPKDLEDEVQKYKTMMKVDLRTLKEGYRAPGPGNAEKRFKEQLFRDEETVGRMFLSLNDVLEELKSDKVKEERDPASKRWQANYDFVLARVEAQIAYLYEYLSMLGQMRKEFPKRDPELHGGWKLAARTTLSGDSTGKKLAKDANKILDKLAKQHKGTPWAILAKRVRLTALGLDWRPAR